MLRSASAVGGDSSDPFHQALMRFIAEEKQLNAYADIFHTVFLSPIEDHRAHQRNTKKLFDMTPKVISTMTEIFGLLKKAKTDVKARAILKEVKSAVRDSEFSVIAVRLFASNALIHSKHFQYYKHRAYRRIEVSLTEDYAKKSSAVSPLSNRQKSSQ